MFVGIHRRVIIPGVLRWCRISSIHSRVSSLVRSGFCPSMATPICFATASFVRYCFQCQPQGSDFPDSTVDLISTLGMVAKNFVFCRPPVKMNRTKKLKKKKHAKSSEDQFPGGFPTRKPLLELAGTWLGNPGQEQLFYDSRPPKKSK